MNVPNNFFEFMNIPILSGHVLKTNSDMVADRKLVERIKKDLLEPPCTIIKIATRYAAFVPIL